MQSFTFNSDENLSERIRIVENAIVVPWGRGENDRLARPAGVFTADGEYCEDAICYRSATRPTTVIPECPDLSEIKHKIMGTTLFGGISYGHFGHALCESTARLWALDHCETPIDQILFFPKRKMTWPKRSLPQIQNILQTLGEHPPCTALNEPTRVERLVLAPQGFGTGNMIAGCPEFRDFTEQRWRTRIKANGPDKLYISRSEVFRKRGRLLLEEEIEKNLVAEGFTIFHPQQHDLKTQLEHYKAAKTIISTDNSALHLAAFVVDASTEIAILIRRPGKIYLDFQEQLQHFAGIDPIVIDSCERYWFRAGEPVQYNEITSLVDFKKTARALSDAGFISDPDWENPSEQNIKQALFEYESKGEMLLEEISLETETTG